MRVLRDGDLKPLLTGAYIGPTPQALLENRLTLAAPQGAPFFVVEIDAFLASSDSLTLAVGHNTTAHNTLSLDAVSFGSTVILRASDRGYRTRASDSGGVLAYPPTLVGAITYDREIPIDPAQTSAGGSWGDITLANDDGRYDDAFETLAVGGRAVRIMRGTPTWDDERGLWISPAYADLVPVFTGLAESWFLDADQLSVRLRDARYWLELPYQRGTYAGSGEYGGDASLTGTALPRARGGTSAHPIRNVTPIRINGPRVIWKASDGPGSVEAIYEGAKAVFTDDGDVGDLFGTAAPASGHSQSDGNETAFELAAENVRAITADVTGAFPVAGAQSILATIARYMITEDMRVPAAYVDTASFSDAAAAYPYIAGAYFPPSEQIDGATAVSRMLAGAHFKLITDRTGKLKCFPLRAVNDATVPVLEITTANCEAITAVRLPASLDPPPARVRIAWQQNFTVQTSDINDTADADQKLFAQSPASYSAYVSPTVAQNYNRPSDPAPIGGSLLVQADADAAALDVGEFLTSGLRTYQVVLPFAVGKDLDLGHVVRMTWPLGPLRAGKLGQVVREQFRSDEDAFTFNVLTN